MKSTKLLASLGAAVLLLLSHSTYAPAQDPAVVNEKTITVKLDNDRVRVLEAVLQPSAKEELHLHPAYVLYVLEGGKMRNHTIDGKVTDSDMKPGQLQRSAHALGREHRNDNDGPGAGRAQRASMSPGSGLGIEARRLTRKILELTGRRSGVSSSGRWSHR